MDGKGYQKAIFDLAEGTGKRRLNTNSEERKPRGWVTCVTISEEVGLADKLRRDGRNAAAGAVARSWEIDVDDASILQADQVNAIDAIKKNFGHAGPVFIAHLIEIGAATDPEAIRDRIEAAACVLTDKSDLPQVRRVARTAAIIAVAGELAQEAGLIPKQYDIADAVKRLLSRSKLRMAKDMDPIDTALTNLREDLIRRLGVDVVDIDYDQEHQNRAVSSYYAYPDENGGHISSGLKYCDTDRVYFIPAEEMFKLGGGNVTATKIASELKKSGFLEDAPGNNNQWSGIPNVGQIKHYRVKGAFFHKQKTQKVEGV